MLLVQAHILATLSSRQPPLQYLYRLLQLSNLGLGVTHRLLHTRPLTRNPLLLLVRQLARTLHPVPRDHLRHRRRHALLLLSLVLANPVIYTTQMLAHTATRKLIHPLHQSVQKVTVVTDHNHRTVKIPDCLLQHILATHIQMVRRLVQYQQVHRLQQQLDHRQTRTLTPAQHLHLPVRGLPAKHKRPQNVTYLGTNLATRHTVNSIKHRQLPIQQLSLVLRKIPYLHIMTHLHHTVKRNLAHDTLDHRRLTLAVASHKRHLLPTLYRQVHMVKHHTVILLARILANHRIVTAALATRKLQVQRTVIHLVHLDGNNLLQLAHPLLYLYRLRRLIAETLDKRPALSNLPLLVLVSTQLLLTPLGTQVHILVIPHLVVVHTSAADFQRTVRHIIHKRTVMTHQHHSTRIHSQKLLQPLYALYIQMIRRLVQQQHVRMLQQQLSQLDTHTPTARKLAHRPVQVPALEAQAHQRPLHVGMIIAATHHLQTLGSMRKLLAQPHIPLALVILATGKLSLHRPYTSLQLSYIGKSLLRLLAHRTAVTQHHHLRQIPHRHITRHRHRPLTGRLDTRNNLQHGTLTRTVLTHQGNTVTVIHHIADTGKQRPGAELHSKIVN